MNAIRTFIRRASTERSINRITLLGRVGADAQLKGTMEHPVVIFNLATNTGTKPEWHRISVFQPNLRRISEEYVKSGSRLLVEGKLSYGHIIDSKGNAMPTTSIIADDIIFLNSKNTETKQQEEESIESI